MSVALVHDYLTQLGGAERVFAHIAAAWPAAPVYTSIYDPSRCGGIVAATRVRTSFVQHLPHSARWYRAYAPLYPAAFERFDLSPYDLVVSSASAWAKGVRTRRQATHVCYLHTVSRFVFNEKAYVGGFAPTALVRPVTRALAAWDRKAALRPTAYIANSQTTADRARRYYGVESSVLHPPIDLDRFTLGQGRGDYALVLSRLLPYKRIDLAIRAAARAGIPLAIAGAGPAETALRREAAGTRTTFHGYVDDRTRDALLGDARVVIVPGIEDFGLVPLEAAAAGRPVIAAGGGGALETVVDGRTGVLFAPDDEDALVAVLAQFLPERFEPAALRAHAASFGPETFIARLRAAVDAARR